MSIAQELANTGWVDVCRPVTIEDIVLPKAYREKFLKYIEFGTIPHLLLHSVSGGTGKSTVARALIHDLGCKEGVLRLNMSDERGIDVLRTKISRFASTKSMSGKIKIVFMDEFDKATPDLQDALRAFIEQYSETCKFIATCNYVNNIIPQLRSRFQEYDFNHSVDVIKSEMVSKFEKRLQGICSIYDVEYKESAITAVVNKLYPDFRKMITVCEQYSVVTKYIDDGIVNFTTVDETFYKLLLDRKINLARKYAQQKGYDYSHLYTLLFEEFVPMLKEDYQAATIVTLGKYQYYHPFVGNKELNFAACIIEMVSDWQ